VPKFLEMIWGQRKKLLLPCRPELRRVHQPAWPRPTKQVKTAPSYVANASDGDSCRSDQIRYGPRHRAYSRGSE
jgi:hypothetical protein